MSISISVKYLVVTAASLLATLLCFLLMIGLISAELTRQPDVISFRMTVPIISPIREKEKREVRRKAKKSLPSEPPTLSNKEINLTYRHLPVESRQLNRASLADILGKEIIEFQITPPLRDLTPLIVVQPFYPFVAAVKEIEGSVLVQFSVRENGTVSNARVIESEPRRTFDEAALNAIRKFKFQPREISGQSVTVDDVQMRFTFSMQDNYAQVSH